MSCASASGKAGMARSDGSAASRSAASGRRVRDLSLPGTTSPYERNRTVYIGIGTLILLILILILIF
jgi:hypothetical protein